MKQFRLASLVVEDIAIGAEGLRFDYREGEVAHSVANGLQPMLRFFGAVLPRCSAAWMSPALSLLITRFDVIPRV